MSANATIPMPTEADVEARQLEEAKERIPNIHHYLGALRYADHAEIMEVARDKRVSVAHKVAVYSYLRRYDSNRQDSPAATHEEALEVMRAGLNEQVYRDARRFSSHSQSMRIHEEAQAAGIGLSFWTNLRRYATEEEAEEVVSKWIDPSRYWKLRKQMGLLHQEAMEFIEQSPP